ncbi:arylesterase [Pseudomarimonas arenosa]|uniref:Arylesterase n=1 Tax=Pseudomarimonas arenosa TaxID=2774145 RepID=A0AAW3ZME5_9GAMM|nr:arylesterase [Pseudomarimonas arenosa]MBD8526913.1 arylesterase [Pseudomarimonas arenosa]
MLAISSLAQAAQSKRILVMGDSLSAAFGLSSEQGWVSLLQTDVKARGWEVINASISGETTAGGKTRIINALAEHRPDIVVIELGANDGLRGLPLDLAKNNLSAMIEAAKRADSEVLLIGMQIPPNYGPDYTQQFIGMYHELAQQHAVSLLPFLLEPVAESRDAFLPDQLHPNAAAQPALAAHVRPALSELMTKVEAGTVAHQATP